MSDRSAAAGATKAVSSPPQQNILKRILELMMMMISMFLVMFAWGEANKAKDEAAILRSELRRAKAEQADRSGTRCTVCLDNPLEVVLQACGHVCLCQDCANRVTRGGDNLCPICRQHIDTVKPAYIS